MVTFQNKKTINFLVGQFPRKFRTKLTLNWTKPKSKNLINFRNCNFAIHFFWFFHFSLRKTARKSNFYTQNVQKGLELKLKWIYEAKFHYFMLFSCFSGSFILILINFLDASQLFNLKVFDWMSEKSLDEKEYNKKNKH